MVRILGVGTNDVAAVVLDAKGALLRGVSIQGPREGIWVLKREAVIERVRVGGCVERSVIRDTRVTTKSAEFGDGIQLGVEHAGARQHSCSPTPWSRRARGRLASTGSRGDRYLSLAALREDRYAGRFVRFQPRTAAVGALLRSGVTGRVVRTRAAEGPSR